jgi:hypothetical protein
MKTNLKRQDLEKVLSEIQNLYDNNLKIVISKEGKKWTNFRLFVKDSKGKGARIGYSGRRLTNACWHAHGHFIDKLFELYPDAVIYSLKNKYTKANWQWQDKNIGSLYQPLYFSEACNCE